MFLKMLSKPFPILTDSGQKWKMSIFLGVFVTLFLWLFRPFGLHNVDQPWVFLGYGFITTIILLFNLFILPKIFPHFYNEQNWTGFRELVVTLYNILIIGLANLIFSAFLGFFEVNFTTIIYFQFITLAVGFLPVTAIILLRQNILLKKNLTETGLINKELKNVAHEIHANEKIRITSDVVNDSITVAADDLVYIASADNYIEIFYLDDGVLLKKLLRNTLKKTCEILSAHPQFFRCHRMYIINLDKVEKVSGNAQGYRLHMVGSQQTVPVSRSLNKTLSDRLLHK